MWKINHCVGGNCIGLISTICKRLWASGFSHWIQKVDPKCQIFRIFRQKYVTLQTSSETKYRLWSKGKERQKSVGTWTICSMLHLHTILTVKISRNEISKLQDRSLLWISHHVKKTPNMNSLTAFCAHDPFITFCVHRRTLFGGGEIQFTSRNFLSANFTFETYLCHCHCE